MNVDTLKRVLTREKFAELAREAEWKEPGQSCSDTRCSHTDCGQRRQDVREHLRKAVIDLVAADVL